MLVLFPVNPLMLARYRDALTPRRAQDDPTDAALQLALLRTQRDTLHPLTPQRPTMRALAQRVAPRRRVGGDNVRITHRLTSTLKHAFPHVLHGLQDKATPSFCDFLRHWPTLQAVHLARRTTLEPCFRDHHGRSPEGIANRLHAIKAAIPLPTDDGVIAPKTLLVQALVAPRRVTLQALAACDTALAQRAPSHPDVPLVQALPGAGPVVAARLFGACGEPRARYPSATALQT